MKTRELTMEEKRGIVKLKAEGKSIRAIAEALGIASTTVWNILHRHAATGTLTTGHRSGRPRKTSALDDRRIVGAVKDDPQITASNIASTLRLAGVRVSQSTVRRRLREQKYHFRFISCVPLLGAQNRAHPDPTGEDVKEEPSDSRVHDVSSHPNHGRTGTGAALEEPGDEPQPLSA